VQELDRKRDEERRDERLCVRQRDLAQIHPKEDRPRAVSVVPLAEAITLSFMGRCSCRSSPQPF